MDIEALRTVYIAVLCIIAFVLVYMLPTWVAQGRRHPQLGAIAMLNFLLGWTILGWAGAMVWACMNSAAPSRTA